MTAKIIDAQITELIAKRARLRSQKRYKEADKIRQRLSDLGYVVTDDKNQSEIKKEKSQILKKQTYGKIALFGSGEMSPTGRNIHEYLIKDYTAPVKIVLLPTPAGFEDNPFVWYRKLQEMMNVGLVNYHPEFFCLPVLRKNGEFSTNNKNLLEPILSAHYIHTGAGSPSYAMTHLKDSLTFEYLVRAVKNGAALSFASAAAIAMGKYCLPVYEIYKAGNDPFWLNGLDFFQKWDLNVTIIPHWNNNEGGREIDTNYCFLGKSRFNKLKKILPGRTNLLCISEQTACIFDKNKKEAEVMGNGDVCIIDKDQERIFHPGQKFSFGILK